jgi:diguanylate cyclase (GGDEF)-like protein
VRTLRATASGHLVGLVRHLLAVLVCAAVVALPAHAAGAAPGPGPAAASTGGIGLRLVEAPASGRKDPRAWTYIVDHLRPGTVIHRQIEVTNKSSSTARVVLYSGAAAISGSDFLGAAGATQNDLSTWTSVSPSSMNVAANRRARMTVTIAVPSDGAPGEQYGVVWAEVRAAPSAGVTQVSRVGIRLYVSVGAGAAPAPDFVIESLTAARSAAGQPMILATVRNTGGRALDMTGTLDLRDGPGGLTAGPYPADLGVTLAPGAVRPVVISLDTQMPAGPWDARLRLRSGLIERTESATISFPAAGTAPPVSVRAARPAWLYIAIAGLGTLLPAGLVVLALRRRRSVSQHVRRLPAETVPSWTPAIAADLPIFAPLTSVEPAVTEPVAADPHAPPQDRRRPVTERASRLAEEPVTVDAIAEAPYHWELALPNSQDALTSLANRSLFEDETQFAMDAGAERLCLLRIGLDEFEEVNRRYGRDVGDEVLVVLAERLRNSVRPKDLTGRLGGVDFAVLFEDVEPADINTIAQRILSAVRQPFTAAGDEVFVQASVGVATADPADDATRLLRHATEALAFARITASADHQWYAEGLAPR